MNTISYFENVHGNCNSTFPQHHRIDVAKARAITSQVPTLIPFPLEEQVSRLLRVVCHRLTNIETT